ncbi:hypothetical protein PN498_02210 [Oscillatoria sp. CS-180]|uniref:hypothetical protein n=1 Tax=Oscillatoria sp. CS-180 TaxID=3021720 RepID=UPI00232D54DC|nr:hypothetical protein [Oscillatoria sp. CS-180]MDB9524788.1 hypothetical protein [Oscillatoria sp. CS-180]
MQERGQGPHCPDLLIDIAVRDALEIRTFEPIVQAIHRQFPVKKRYTSHGPRSFPQESTWLRDLRIAIYRQDLAEIETLFDDARQAHWRLTHSLSEVLQHIINNPFDADWFSSLSLDFRQYGLRLTLTESAQKGLPADDAFELIEEMYHAGQADTETCLVYTEQLWLRGHLGEASGVLSETDINGHAAKEGALRGAIAFLTGQNEDAIAYFQMGLKAAGKTKTAQASWFDNPAAALYFFALLNDGMPAALQEVESHCQSLQRQSDHWLQESMSPLWRSLHNQRAREDSSAQAPTALS